MSISGSPDVTILNLQGLLDRLGVRGIPRFDLLPHVLPVAIVDGAVQAVGLQTLDVPFTAGETTAPAANTRLANTGALIKGQYNMTILASAAETWTMRIRRRNAGDTADIWAHRIPIFTGANLTGINFALRLVLAVNEFVVVENVNAGGAGIVYQASIWVQGPF